MHIIYLIITFETPPSENDSDPQTITEAVTRIMEYMDGLKTVDQPVIDMFQSIVDNYDTGTSVGHVDTVVEWLEEQSGSSVFLRII